MESIEILILNQFKIVNIFGDFYVVPIISLVFIILTLIHDKHKRESLILFFSTISYPASLILKIIFKHERPLGADVTTIFFVDNYSFPSTHVMFYTCFFGYLMYLSLRMESENKYIRLAVFTLSMYMIIMVGISRVLAGVHWPADVLAGYLFGFISLLILVIIDIKMKRFKSDDNTDSKKIEII